MKKKLKQMKIIKNGFTLVELLAVLVILSVIATIVFPTVISSIRKSKENAYNIQVSTIEESSRNWMLEKNNIDSIINTVYISLKTLIQEKYIQEMENPLNGKVMNGCVRVLYMPNENQYSYTYVDVTCDSLISTDNPDHYYMIDYDETVKKEDLEHIGISAGKEIVNIEFLHYGEDLQSGLYEEEESYVFKGEDVNNYLKINNTLYRIMSIDKKDYSIRLISTTYDSTPWCDNDKYICDKSIYKNFSSSKPSFELSVKLETLTEKFNKIKKDSIYGIGAIDEVNDTSTVLKSIENSQIVNGNYGLIRVSDYLKASTTDDINNNYLANMFGDSSVWTMNFTSEFDKWVIKNKNLQKVTPSVNDTTYRAYLVIEVKESSYIISGTGSEASPYVIK